MKRLKDLPIGSLVKDTETTIFGNPIVWKIADQNHMGYPEDSTTLIADKCIAYRDFDAAEPNNPLTMGQGWAYYPMSNIRQWLNSNAEAGQWYEPQHEYDVASRFANRQGFLKDFSEFFTKSLLDTEISTYSLSQDKLINTTDKIFLPSFTEIGLRESNSRYTVEGVQYPVFTNNESRVTSTTEEALADGGYQTQGYNKPVGYCLRSARYNTEESVTYVETDGSNNGTAQPQSTWPIRPACNIKSNVYVSSFPDQDGAYILMPHKKIYIYKPDSDVYLMTSEDEYLCTEEGFTLITADNK